MKVTGAAADLQQRCALDAPLADPLHELPLGPLETEQAEAQPVKAGEAGEEAARIGIDGGAAAHVAPRTTRRQKRPVGLALHKGLSSD